MAQNPTESAPSSTPRPRVPRIVWILLILAAAVAAWIAAVWGVEFVIRANRTVS